MPNKNLKILLLIWLGLLSSCSLTVPDVPLCTEINPDRGYCVNTLSSKEFEITKEKKYKGKTWWEMRPRMIYMPVESWVEIKKFIIKVCKKSKKCKNKQVSNWSRTVKAIDTKIAL